MSNESTFESGQLDDSSHPEAEFFRRLRTADCREQYRLIRMLRLRVWHRDKLSQRLVGDILGLNKSTLGSYERNQKKVDPPSLTSEQIDRLQRRLDEMAFVNWRAVMEELQ